MPRGQELTPQLRSRLCELKAVGWSTRRIQRQHPTIPLSTIKYTLKKEAERANCVSKPRLGRPRALTEEQRDHLYDLSVRQPHLKYRDMINEVDEAVKKRSIQGLFHEMGRRKWRQLNRPHLEEIHARKRLQWAREYEHFTPQDWARVFWSDECTIERGVGLQPAWTFRRPREQILEGDVRTRKASGKAVKQMFWAAFNENSCTGLVPLDGDPDSPGGGISARVIRDLYQAFLPDFIGPDDIFMQDNAPVHKAHIIMRLLEDLRITVMIWPPYSPDLNPIENLWALIKQEIYKLHPELEHAPDNEDTLHRLIAAAREAWQAIEQRVRTKLSATMPHRVRAVIKADGWYTKY